MSLIIEKQVTSPILPTPTRPSPFNQRTLWALLFGVAIIWALAQTGIFRQDLVNEEGWTRAARFFEASLHPDLSSPFLRLVLDAAITTLAFAVCGTFLSLIFGFVGGIMASEVWWESFLPKQNQGRWFRIYRAPWLALRSGLALLRGVHEIIWALVFINIIGLNPLSAILAIAIPFGAVTAKVFSEILDETPRRPLITLQNSGVSPTKAFIYTLIPQAFRDWLSYGFYRFECSIRAAAVLGIIGAGGLGYQIFLSLQTLKYEQIWTLFIALLILNGLADAWSAVLRRRLGSTPSCSGLVCDSGVGQPSPLQQFPSSQQDSAVRVSLIAMTLLTAFSFWYIAPDFGKLFSMQAWQQLGYIARRAFPPDFGTFPLSEWLRLAGITMAMSLLAVAMAGIFGLILSFPAAHNFLLPGGLLDAGRGGTLRRFVAATILLLTRGILLVARSIPPPIWALILLFVLFPGILPGAVALGLYTLGVLGRLMAEVIENLDNRPLKALKAQGASGGQVFAYGVLPSTFPRYLGYLLYRWEEVIRATVVIGLVGAGGLGRLLIEQLSSFDFQGVLTTLIVFVGLTLMVDLISAKARRTFRE
jgi:phosphonate transport system permease protein